MHFSLMSQGLDALRVPMLHAFCFTNLVQVILPLIVVIKVVLFWSACTWFCHTYLSA